MKLTLPFDFAPFKSISALWLSLLIFVIALPSFEAPKKIFMILFFCIGVFLILKNITKYHFDYDDLLMLVWMGSGYVVGAFSGIDYKEWGGAFGVFQLALLLFLLRHHLLGNKHRYFWAIVILVSTLWANAEGLWSMFVSGKKSALELDSVGHVNHSAIYLCLNFSLALAMTLILQKKDSFFLRFYIVFCLLLTSGSIIISDSRATVVTMFIIIMSFGLVWFKRSKLFITLLLLISIFVGFGMVLGKASVVQKQISFSEQASATEAKILGPRAAIWNSALLAFQQYPVFGLGIGNFGQATAELQAQWATDQHKSYSQAIEGQSYTEGQFLPYAHAHNLYLSTLAEQGLFGFTITMLVLIRICFLLYKNRPKLMDDNYYWMFWCAAFGVMQVILINGLLNTTFHHEHGLLSVLLIGLWWSSLKERAQS
jgi:O-antigen ligase